MSSDIIAPNPGDPISAKWAAAVTHGVNAAKTLIPAAEEMVTPGGRVPPPAAPTRQTIDPPQLWTVRFRTNPGAAADVQIYCNKVNGHWPVCINGETVALASGYVTGGGWVTIGKQDNDTAVTLDWAVTSEHYQSRGVRAFAVPDAFAFRTNGETLPTGYVFYSDVSSVYMPWLPTPALAAVGSFGWERRHAGAVLVSMIEADGIREAKNSRGTVGRSINYTPGADVLQLYNFGNVSGSGHGSSVLVRTEDAAADDPTYTLDYIHGAGGHFTTADGKIVGVQHGVITSIETTT